MNRILDKKAINDYTKELSMEYFGRPFESTVDFNNRLKSVAGRCFTKTGKIELATTYTKHCDNEALKGTILHELIHYHLDRAGYVNEHHGRVFKEYAMNIGAPRYAKAIPIEYYNHIEVTCTNCGNHFKQKKAFDTTKYVCGKCRKSTLTFKRVKAIE